MALSSLTLLGWKLNDLAVDHAKWSQANFGTDEQSGPCRPLTHMAKEIKEALAAVEAGDKENLLEELADLGLLWLDARRRAGHNLFAILLRMEEKMVENQTRQWPPFDPAGDPCKPAEHVR
jgi:NTP pyrophosphatase (non-canonical NTP hydrolase)